MFKNKTVLVNTIRALRALGYLFGSGKWVKVVGYSFLPIPQKITSALAGLESKVVSIYEDIRDYEKLKGIFLPINPR